MVRHILATIFWEANPKAQSDVHERRQLWTLPHWWPVQTGLHASTVTATLLHSKQSVKVLQIGSIHMSLESWNHGRHRHKRYGSPSRNTPSVKKLPSGKTKLRCNPPPQSCATVQPQIEPQPGWKCVYRMNIARFLSKAQTLPVHRTMPILGWTNWHQALPGVRSTDSMRSSLLSVLSNSLKHDGTSAFLACKFTTHLTALKPTPSLAFVVCDSHQSKEPQSRAAGFPTHATERLKQTKP